MSAPAVCFCSSQFMWNPTGSKWRLYLPCNAGNRFKQSVHKIFVKVQTMSDGLKEVNERRAGISEILCAGPVLTHSIIDCKMWRKIWLKLGGKDAPNIPTCILSFLWPSLTYKTLILDVKKWRIGKNWMQRFEYCKKMLKLDQCDAQMLSHLLRGEKY